MMEYDMKRNGSEYYDETPVKTGLFSGPQPGEIWESTFGKEFLILKNHGPYCTTLALNDNQHPDTIAVASRTVKHTNPGMLGYSFNDNLVQYIKNVPEDNFLSIMEAVGDRLGVTIKVNRAEDDNLVHKLEAMCKDLQHSLEEANREIDCIARERDALREEQHERCMKEGQAGIAAVVKAEMFENLYKDLLQKCLARGEA